MQIIRVPAWGLYYGGAEYFGRRHFVHIGLFVILWGQMTPDEIEAWDKSR